MKTKLTIISLNLTVALVVAALLLLGSSLAWSRHHRRLVQPLPTPAVQPNTSLLADPNSDTVRQEQSQGSAESNKEGIAQLQDLRHPIRVLIYQGSASVKVRSAIEPSPALYPASCQWRNPNLLIDGCLSEVSEREIKLNGPSSELLSCTPGYVLQVGGVLYRGCIKVERDDACLRLVNYVSLEDYLRGVVPKELLCNSSEAVKAQAIVARTYALSRRFSDKTYDVDCGTRSQVYGGASAEAAVSDQAVAETLGLVLTYHGKLAGQTLYHSACGGKTESPLYVYGTCSEPYLVSVNCLDEQGVADCAASPYASWQARWSKDELGQELSQYFGKKLGPVVGLEVVEQGPSGRVSKLKVHFNNDSTVLLEYGAIRSALRFKDSVGKIRPLPSAKFTITEGLFESSEMKLMHSEPTTPILGQVLNLLGTEKALEEEIADLRQSQKLSDEVVLSGQGWGHGVGMCQWGAIGMAKRGKDYSQILARYFVDTQIDSLENLALTL